MKILIYNPNSFGGNYEYALRLVAAYNKLDGVKCLMLTPSSLAVQKHEIVDHLLSDIPKTKNKFLKKIYFIYRSFVNPLLLLFYVYRRNFEYIIFNDFDQLTSPLWSPMFRIFLPHITRLVILHDPDRDQYLPLKFLSSFTMKAVMQAMHIGLYHEVLPEKNYYQQANILYQKVPHGIYELSEEALPRRHAEIEVFKQDRKLISILGNIREEKNYRLIISSLVHLTETCLLIAGKPANSSISVEQYKQYADSLGVGDRILWYTHYLSEAELKLTIKQSHAIALYYKSSFASQSGLLNLIAPFKKKILVAETASALSKVVKDFSLAPLIRADDEHAFVKQAQEILNSDIPELEERWNAYLAYASWDNHAAIVLETIRQYESTSLGRSISKFFI